MVVVFSTIGDEPDALPLLPPADPPLVDELAPMTVVFVTMVVEFIVPPAPAAEDESCPPEFIVVIVVDVSVVVVPFVKVDSVISVTFIWVRV